MPLSNVLWASLLAVSMQSSNEFPAATGVVAAPEPSQPTTVEIGQPAPEFVFRSHEYGWRTLHDVLEQGSLLLVFGGSDAQLRSLQDSYRPLVDAGVVPMVVTPLGSAEAWKAIERCGIRYSLLADPKLEIASQFGLSADAFEGWYLIDAKGRVRGHGLGTVPAQDWSTLATAALADDAPQASTEE